MAEPEPDASADDPLDSTGSVELEIVNGNGALMRTTWVVSGRVTTLVVYRGSASSRRLRSSAASGGAAGAGGCRTGGGGAGRRGPGSSGGAPSRGGPPRRPELHRLERGPCKPDHH